MTVYLPLIPPHIHHIHGFCWMSLPSRVALLVACHTNHFGLDGQTSLEHLERLICFSSVEAGDPCSSSLSFKMLHLEAACSCPRVYRWRHLHREERRKAECVWTAGSSFRAAVYFMYMLDSESLKPFRSSFPLLFISKQLCFIRNDL